MTLRSSLSLHKRDSPLQAYQEEQLDGTNTVLNLPLASIQKDRTITLLSKPSRFHPYPKHTHCITMHTTTTSSTHATNTANKAGANASPNKACQQTNQHPTQTHSTHKAGRTGRGRDHTQEQQEDNGIYSYMNPSETHIPHFTPPLSLPSHRSPT